MINDKKCGTRNAECGIKNFGFQIANCGLFVLVILIVIGTPLALAAPARTKQKSSVRAEARTANKSPSEIDQSAIRNPQSAIEKSDWHDEYSAKDLHIIAATVGSWADLRITRVIDSGISLVIPGSPHPCEGTVNGIRVVYHRSGMSNFKPTRRAGDLCKALLIREFSLSDLYFKTNYERFQGLIDWGQLVVADCGDVVFWPTGESSMVVLKYPYWVIDRCQDGFEIVEHKVAIFLSRIGNSILNGAEHPLDPQKKVTLPPQRQVKLVFAE